MSTAKPRTGPRRALSPEFPLLGLLMEGPSHGYDLHQRLSTEMGNIWHLSQSQTYSVLKRLEKRGDISASREAAAKLPRRQILQITAAGRRRFKHWLEGAASSGARSVRLEFLTRLYFASLLAPVKVSQIYSSQNREITRTVRRLRLALRAVPEIQTFNRLSLDLRLRQMELIRQWLQEVRLKLPPKTKGSP